MGAEAKKAPPSCCSEMRVALAAYTERGEAGLAYWAGGDYEGGDVAPGVYLAGCDGCLAEEPVRFCPFCGKALS